MTDQKNTDLAQFAQWVTENTGAKVHDVIEANNPFAIVPNGARIASIRSIVDEWRDKPVREQGVSSHETLDSLIEHAKRVCPTPSPAATMVAFAQQKPARIVVVYDYDSSTGPNWRNHRAIYEFPENPDFGAWRKAFGAQLSTEAFAALIEDRLTDVVDPAVAEASGFKIPSGMRLADAATLLTLAEGLQVNIAKGVREIRRQDNGTASLSYEEEHSTKDARGATITVPNGFMLALAPFVDGERFAVPIRLRYKMVNNALYWTLTPHNLDIALREAVRKDCKRFADATGLKLFWGVPELAASVR